MKKGWKTRFDEREYFEQKKEVRENKRAFMEMVRRRMEEDMAEYLNEMKEQNATH
jgi:excinuclease UvrABC helicase subunit UvrB